MGHMRYQSSEILHYKTLQKEMSDSMSIMGSHTYSDLWCRNSVPRRTGENWGLWAVGYGERYCVRVRVHNTVVRRYRQNA